MTALHAAREPVEAGLLVCRWKDPPKVKYGGKKGIIGSVFEGQHFRSRWEDLCRNIRGTAFLSAEADLVLDPRDRSAKWEFGHELAAVHERRSSGAGIVRPPPCAYELARRGLRVAIVDREMVEEGRPRRAWVTSW